MQHQPPPAHSCIPLLLPCSQHFLILCLSPWASHHLLPCPVPNPQPLDSLLLFSSQDQALPLPPLCLQPSHHQFYTLLQLSDPLLQGPGFPRSCLHVSLFLTLNKPITWNRTMSFPTPETNPAPNHLTIPKLQPQLCSSKKGYRKHPTANRSL